MTCTIAIDMDGTIADLHGEIVDRFNKYFDDEIMTVDDITEWGLDKLPLFKAYFMNELQYNPTLFETLKPIPGAIGTINSWHALDDINILFVTVPIIENPESVLCKYKWLQRYFPWVQKSNIIMPFDIGSKKHIDCDIMIDDSPLILALRNELKFPIFVSPQPYNTEYCESYTYKDDKRDVWNQFDTRVKMFCKYK